MITTLGFLEPGYNHILHTISALGGVEGPRKTIFQLSGIITGLLIILFGIGFHYGIDHGRGSIVGPLLIIISGVGLVGVSIFLHEHIGKPDIEKPMTIIRALHLLSASISVSAAGLSPFFFYKRFKLSRLWKDFSSPTIIAGIVSNIPSLVMAIGLLTSSLQGVKGLLEKLSVLFPLIWLMVIATRLFLIMIRKEGKWITT